LSQNVKGSVCRGIGKFQAWGGARLPNRIWVDFLDLETGQAKLMNNAGHLLIVLNLGLIQGIGHG
jgi:hypothetical protein